VELAGVQLAAEEIRRADLLLWVRDVATPPATMLDTSQFDPAKTLAVWNKCDLLPEGTDGAPDRVFVSAKTGQGIEALSHAIAKRLVPNPPERGAAVPFAIRHVVELNDVREWVQQGRARTMSERVRSWLGQQNHSPLPGEIRE